MFFSFPPILTPSKHEEHCQEQFDESAKVLPFLWSPSQQLVLVLVPNQKEETFWFWIPAEETTTNLHLVVDLEGVSKVVLARSDLRDPLLKVEDVDGELVSLGGRRPKQLGRVLHEGLVGLGKNKCLWESICLDLASFTHSLVPPKCIYWMACYSGVLCCIFKTNRIVGLFIYC